MRSKMRELPCLEIALHILRIKVFSYPLGDNTFKSFLGTYDASFGNHGLYMYYLLPIPIEILGVSIEIFLNRNRGY